MKSLPRLLGLAVLIALGIWSWNFFFPAPQKIIEKNLFKLAGLVSFYPGQGNFKKLSDAERIGSLVTEKVQVQVETPGNGPHTFDGREELMQAVLAARSSVRGLTVKFTDINVTVNPDRQSATAVLTVEVRVTGESDLIVNALKFGFTRKESDWLISRVETVKSLK